MAQINRTPISLEPAPFAERYAKLRAEILVAARFAQAKGIARTRISYTLGSTPMFLNRLEKGEHAFRIQTLISAHNRLVVLDTLLKEDTYTKTNSSIDDDVNSVLT